MAAYELPRTIASMGSILTRARHDFASALVRLGTGNRFQHASEEPESYVLSGNLRNERKKHEHALAQLSRGEAFIEVADAWVGSVVDTLSQLNAEVSSSASPDRESELRSSVKNILSQTHNNRGFNTSTTHDTLTLPSGNVLSLTFTIADLVDTAALGSTAEIRIQMDHAQSFAQKLEAYKARIDSQTEYSSAMITGFRTAGNRVTDIDEAAELAVYVDAEIRMHAAKAVISQASLSSQAMMLLFR